MFQLKDCAAFLSAWFTVNHWKLLKNYCITCHTSKILLYSMIDDQASIFMSSLEMCVCVCILYEFTLCGQLAERAQDGHRCYYCLRVSPFLTDSHTVAQLETAYYPMTRAYSTHTDTRVSLSWWGLSINFCCFQICIK